MNKKIIFYGLIIAFFVTNISCSLAAGPGVYISKVSYYGDFQNPKERDEIIKKGVKLPILLQTWPLTDSKFSPDNIFVTAELVNSTSQQMQNITVYVAINYQVCKAEADRKTAEAIKYTGLYLKTYSTQKIIVAEIGAQSKKLVIIGKINLASQFENEFSKNEVLPVLYKTVASTGITKQESILPCDGLWADK